MLTCALFCSPQFSSPLGQYQGTALLSFSIPLLPELWFSSDTSWKASIHSLNHASFNTVFWMIVMCEEWCQPLGYGNKERHGLSSWKPPLLGKETVRKCIGTVYWEWQLRTREGMGWAACQHARKFSDSVALEQGHVWGEVRGQGKEKVLWDNPYVCCEYVFRWLIIKQICPIARYNKARESQTEKNREGQNQIETPVTYPRSKMLEDR